MRLAICTLSAVLLSGCSWMGMGSSSSSSYGYGYGAGNGCATGQYGQTAGYNGYQLGTNGCGAGGYGYGQGAGGYGAAGAYGQGAGGYGYGQAAGGYGQSAGGGYGAGANGYGVGTGGALGLRGVQGAGAYGAGMTGYGAGGAYGYGAGGTTLGGAAPYGSAAGGQVFTGGTQYAGGSQYASGGQWVNGQWVAGGTTYGGGTVQTVQGAPIYVPQPYPAYYGVAAGGGLRGGSIAMPFGLEASIGTEIGLGGDIFPGAIAKPAGTNNISAIDPIAYKDAYKNAINYGMAASYDIDPSTTLLASVGYSKAEGERQKIGTIDDGGAVSEDLFAQWSDLEQVTLEGGVRKYMGGWNNGLSGVRPYVQGTAGFTHNSAVDLVQDSATLAPAALNTQQYIDAGWTPTASGMVGAEMQVGPRTAIGVEAGVRWRDDLNTNLVSEDRWSIPVQLRGRVSF